MAEWNKIKQRGSVLDKRGSRNIFIGGGIGTVLLMMGVSYLMGGNPLDVLLQADPNQLQQSLQSRDTSEFEGEDAYEMFISTILGSTDQYWNEEFREEFNRDYQEPSLVLFRGATQSQCGGAYSQSGPHYCPLDNQIYLDETFFTQLQEMFSTGGGDVAEAYVIAHEVGHHVQHELDLLGYNRSQEESIAVELQADCFAGVWLHQIDKAGVLGQQEIEEALEAAATVGDDNIQKTLEGTISPETWTHGSSKQRYDSVMKGFTSGESNVCLS